MMPPHAMLERYTRRGRVTARRARRLHQKLRRIYGMTHAGRLAWVRAAGERYGRVP
jgi:hypothetical protein